MTDCFCFSYIFAGVGVLMFISSFLVKMFYKFFAMCHEKTQLNGKVVVITGANAGCGKETALDLAKRGATVIMACRDMDKGQIAFQEIKSASKNENLYLKHLELGSLQCIKEFSEWFLERFDKLHFLINNAGIMMCPYWKTEDGFEMQFGVNHLGHFALTNLLLKCMVDTGPGRIINVSSRAHTYVSKIDFENIDSKKSYSKIGAYARSKLANILFTKELTRKLYNTNLTAYALHPGAVSTELGRHIPSYYMPFLKLVGALYLKTAKEGAQTTIYCVTKERLEEHNGMYFSHCRLTSSNKASFDEGQAKKLWELSEEMTGVKFPL